MRVLADGREEWGAAEWRKVFEKFETSALSALAFCRHEKTSRSTCTRVTGQSLAFFPPRRPGCRPDAIQKGGVRCGFWPTAV